MSGLKARARVVVSIVAPATIEPVTRAQLVEIERRGASAILELSHVIQTLFALNDPDKGITVNVGTVDGGSLQFEISNPVPAAARPLTCAGAVRSAPGADQYRYTLDIRSYPFVPPRPTATVTTSTTSR